jgi:hypothetical protein
VHDQKTFLKYLKTLSTPACCEAADTGRSLAKKKKQRSKSFGYQKLDELAIVGPEDIKII